VRSRIVDRSYCASPAKTGDIPAIVASIGGQRVLVSIAFADPEAIDWQARLVRRYVPHAVYVVADNSPGNAEADAIAAAASRHGVAYLRLPQHAGLPPSFRFGSRSHGLALNWVWRNVILPGAPEAFGFLDHDLFPTAPDDPFAPLAGQDFFGVLRPAETRWFLWAGFCTFRFERVRSLPLDFGQDWFVGLDTGGGNWEVLYRHVDRARLAFQETHFAPYKPGLEWSEAPFQWCGSWLHEVGLMGRPELAADKRRVVRDILAPHLIGDQGADRELG
jgi:hypothetical protein